MTTADTLLRAADEFSLLPEGSRVLCALSGGADSVAMTLALIESAEKRKLTVFAAHLNHGLRGDESDRDEAFSKSFCAAHAVPFLSERADIAKHAAESGRGIEETARILRYDFLERAADSFGCDKIATAHNQNDNAETLILNLVRGAGLDGLGGIPPSRGRIVRPMLMAARKDIERFLAERGQAYVTDSTNSDTAYSRNLIRHIIIPELKKLNPNLIETLASSAMLLRADADYLNAAIAERVQTDGSCARIPLEALEGEPDAVKSRIFREACRTAGGILPTRRQTEAFLRLAASKNPSSEQNLAGGLLARREYAAIIVEYSADIPEPEPFVLRLGENRFGVWRIFAAYTDFVPSAPEPDTVYLLPVPLESIIVRARREGDRLAAAGRGWTKTLKKLYIERRVPRLERGLTPVLEAEGKPAAVPFDEPYRAECSEEYAAKDSPALKIVFEYDKRKLSVEEINNTGGTNGEKRN